MRVVLIGILLLAATSAWAEWVKVTETGDTVFYVDPAAIGSKGGMRQASVIHDYAKQESGGVRSRQVSYEIDCIGERMRSVSVTEYSEPLGRGGRMGSRERESEWLYVAPRTGSNIASNATYRAILRFVCSR